MVTLLSSLIGFIGAMVPDVFALLRERQDRQFEREMLALQLKQQELGRSERLDEVRARTDAAEARALYQTWKTGVEWVDALNGTVRPVLAYAFFLLYASTKLLQWGLLDTASPLPWQVQALWGEEDQAIFAGIISFYFGQRAFGKLRK
jgi:hypothetical protein